MVAPQPRLPLGLRRQLDYVAVEARLEPGDRLLLLTDGLPEAPIAEGEPLGYEALDAILGRIESRESPEAWLDSLLATLRAATSLDLEDDWTALLVERTADPRGS